MLLKIVIVLSLMAVTSLSDALSVTKVNSTREVQAKPRTVDKTLSLLFDLFKLYNSIKSKKKPSVLKKSSKVKNSIVPFDGLFFDDYFNQKVDAIDRFPTLADINKQEIMMKAEDMKDKDKDALTKNDPHHSLIKKYLKDMNVLVLIKVFLKLIIFKGIVKFIALVCLLFFLPTLNVANTASTGSSEESRDLDVFGK